MSYDTDTGHKVWVSDLDDWVDLDGIFTENEAQQQEDQLNGQIAEIGDIGLFAERSISSRTLYERGILPQKWRWMLHEAEASLGRAHSCAEIEAGFLKAILASGRRYAVARYARSERLAFSSAITATFPYGIRALLYQYMAGEVALGDISQQKIIHQAFQDAIANHELMAYDRTGLVRQRLHQLAIAGAGPNGHLSLSKEGMRNALSLCRLYFSTIECNIRSIPELINLNWRYDFARSIAERKFDQSRVITGNYVENWKIRHLRPLIYFYPYSARNALARAIHQTTKDMKPLSRAHAANELALARCGIDLMRKFGKDRYSLAGKTSEENGAWK